jgi:peroxiredoxin
MTRPDAQGGLRFRDNMKALAKADTVVVGVSADSGESHRAYRQAAPFTSDPDRSR